MYVNHMGGGEGGNKISKFDELHERPMASTATKIICYCTMVRK